MSTPLQIIRGASEELTPGAARFRTIGLEQLEHLPTPIELVEGLVPDPALTFLNGAPGAGKTFLALDLALSVATFRGSWYGRKPRGGPFVYAVGEGLASIRRRVGAWAWANPDAGTGPIAFRELMPDLCETGSVLDFVELAAGPSKCRPPSARSRVEFHAGELSAVGHRSDSRKFEQHFNLGCGAMKLGRPQGRPN